MLQGMTEKIDKRLEKRHLENKKRAEAEERERQEALSKVYDTMKSYEESKEKPPTVKSIAEGVAVAGVLVTIVCAGTFLLSRINFHL